MCHDRIADHHGRRFRLVRMGTGSMNGIDLLIELSCLGLAIIMIAVAAWQGWDDRRRQERLEDRRIFRSLILRERSWFDSDSDESCV
jgi:hypothetical protein